MYIVNGGVLELANRLDWKSRVPAMGHAGSRPVPSANLIMKKKNEITAKMRKARREIRDILFKGDNQPAKKEINGIIKEWSK